MKIVADELHRSLQVGYVWAEACDENAAYDALMQTVILDMREGAREYTVSLHMVGDALVLSVALAVVNQPVDELVFRRELDGCNAGFPFGAFLYSAENGIVIYRDALDPHEEELEEEDVQGLYECAVEAMDYLCKCIPEAFGVSDEHPLVGMVPIGSA